MDLIIFIFVLLNIVNINCIFNISFCFCQYTVSGIENLKNKIVESYSGEIKKEDIEFFAEH